MKDLEELLRETGEKLVVKYRPTWWQNSLLSFFFPDWMVGVEIWNGDEGTLRKKQEACAEHYIDVVYYVPKGNPPSDFTIFRTLVELQTYLRSRLSGEKPQTYQQRKAQDLFIKEAAKVHNGKYNYDKVVYRGNNIPVLIQCPVHGYFEQRPDHHKDGHGCMLCSGRAKHTRESFEAEARKIHGDKYGYEGVEYINAHTPIKIYCRTCEKHFTQFPTTHLGGAGCPACAAKRTASILSLTKEQFIERAREVHGDKFNYDDVVYVNNHTHITLVCPDCGATWRIMPHNHLRGRGCPVCAQKKRGEAQRGTCESFKEKAMRLHGDKYNYDDVRYVDSATKVWIHCNQCGINFEQTPNHHLNGCGCPACAFRNSRGEEEVAEYVGSLGFEVVRSKWDIVKRKEIDIYVPEKKLAIEYDGLYWHSDACGKGRNYHLDKTEACEANGVRLIHIFEDEWQYHKEIVKSRLSHILCANREEIIYGRKCKVVELTSKETTPFLKENHLQGSCSAKKHYGLSHNGGLVAVMTFGVPRMKKRRYTEDYDSQWEMLRYATKIGTSVVGGAGKLLKHFIREIQPHTIITYADKRWSQGGLYFRLGFTYTHNSKPNYYYLMEGHREGRFKYRKDVLIRQGFDVNKSEKQIMEERGIPRIYDCGNMVFRMDLSE
ncbi:MAG: hypothetical protein LUD72_01610 [Bacteroidales bacterium]|nr:hypothetical protein [Bacteroidales bacterium]